MCINVYKSRCTLEGNLHPTFQHDTGSNVGFNAQHRVYTRRNDFSMLTPYRHSSLAIGTGARRIPVKERLVAAARRSSRRKKDDGIRGRPSGSGAPARDSVHSKESEETKAREKRCSTATLISTTNRHVVRMTGASQRFLTVLTSRSH